MDDHKKSSQHHAHTHTRELILIGSNGGPSSVGLVHTWDPIELC